MQTQIQSAVTSARAAEAAAVRTIQQAAEALDQIATDPLTAALQGLAASAAAVRERLDAGRHQALECLAGLVAGLDGFSDEVLAPAQLPAPTVLQLPAPKQERVSVAANPPAEQLPTAPLSVSLATTRIANDPNVHEEAQAEQEAAPQAEESEGLSEAEQRVLSTTSDWLYWRRGDGQYYPDTDVFAGTSAQARADRRTLRRLRERGVLTARGIESDEDGRLRAV